jgi:hypothetical protein
VTHYDEKGFSNQLNRRCPNMTGNDEDVYLGISSDINEQKIS